MDNDANLYNVPYVDKEYFLNLINKTELSLIFSVSTEKRLLKDNYDSNEQERYPWQYYFTLYELMSSGEIKEIYHHSFNK